MKIDRSCVSHPFFARKYEKYDFIAPDVVTGMNGTQYINRRGISFIPRMTAMVMDDGRCLSKMADTHAWVQYVFAAVLAPAPAER